MPMNIFFLSYFVKAAFFMESIGPGHDALLPVNLWVMQIPIGLIFLLWNIKRKCSGTPSRPRSSSRHVRAQYVAARVRLIVMARLRWCSHFSESKHSFSR